jgi:hypothetical protein
MQLPFSQKQAEKVCKEYKKLIGKPLPARADLSEPITHILIGPWDELNKWIFLEEFNKCKNVETAMEFYKLSVYDIILLARYKDRDEYYYKDLRSYCKEQDIHFEMEKYATLSDPIIKWLPKKV